MKVYCEAMIPKKIHYIWFGKKIKPELIQQCMKKTKSLLPDWEIHEWTEENYDIEQCKYMKEAYEREMYAFASDYARFDILYRYGGVYLDTDVELLQKIPNILLRDWGFTGMESNQKIAPGLIFAVEAGNEIVKEILDSYRADCFVNSQGKRNSMTVVDRVTEIFFRYGFQKNGKEQIIKGIHIYPLEYFCAYDFVSGEFEITEKTISIHHYAASWIDKKRRIRKKIQKSVYKMLGKEKYMKLVTIKRKFFGVREE